MHGTLRLGVLLALALSGFGCGSAAQGSGFGEEDSGVDVSTQRETGVLGKADVGNGQKDSTTTMLGTPDTGAAETGCSSGVTCASAGVGCGQVADGCGGLLQCGGCPSGQTCGGGGTASQCGSACTPKTCAGLGINCGPAGDGCGGSLSCGSCTDGGTCGGGGTASQCGSTSTCVPKTCAELAISCGPAGDGCGNSLDCGSCTAPQTCGGGGTPSVCGAPPCVPNTCATLGFTCGPASDGCGSELECGSCTAPTACGGGTKPGVCGCTGTCAELPTCPGATTTTLSGKVYDPADLHPLYNVLVYIPNNTTDPALTSPFPAGVTCDQCGGASAAGDPLVTTNTAYDGTFTLSNIPVGSSIPLVIQLGRWRRQFTVKVATPCGANTVSVATTTPDIWLASTAPALATSGHLTMPTRSTYGDIPRIAILSGSYDMVECELRKIGLADSEFVNPGAWGQGNHVQFYQAADPTSVEYGDNTLANGSFGTGAVINASTPLQTQLFGTDATTGKLNLDQYDLVINECEGYPETEPTAQQTSLSNYAGAGGRVFASDFAYDWLFQNPGFEGAANWGGNHSGCGFIVTGDIDPPPGNPTGTVFQDWLQLTGVSTVGSGTVAITPAFPNVASVIAPTQEWLHTTSSEYNHDQCGGSDVPDPIPIHFTFNTPLGAAPVNQCGRVTFSDWHTQNGLTSQGYSFPNECEQDGTSSTMTDQETILEFMLFDATACVTPYQATCTSESCAQQGITCGPAGDGCGNLLECGTCPAGDTCGGGGSPGVCGAPQCTPTTCASQGIACGPAGNGCGGALSCGTCPAGQTCGGGGTPGVCGAGACTAKTCAEQNISCGPAGDGCGNALSCGTCAAGETCGGGGTPGKCGTTCTPKTCASQNLSCGPAGDGCGNQLNCGACVSPETCGGGGTAGVCGTTTPH